MVNLRHEPYDVYIGRAGRGQAGTFGNPVATWAVCPECGAVHTSGGATLGCYQRYLARRVATVSFFTEAVQALRGRVLGCFCRPPEGFQGRLLCHGQILAAWLDGCRPEDVP